MDRWILTHEIRPKSNRTMKLTIVFNPFTDKDETGMENYLFSPNCRVEEVSDNVRTIIVDPIVI